MAVEFKGKHYYLIITGQTQGQQHKTYSLTSGVTEVISHQHQSYPHAVLQQYLQSMCWKIIANEGNSVDTRNATFTQLIG